MFVRLSGALLALCCVFAGANVARASQVGGGVVTYNGGASQDFNALVNTGTSSTLPTGWYFFTTTTSTYAADDGSLNTTGNVYSYGSSGSTDRAFGSMVINAMGSVGTVAARIGAQLKNQSGGVLSQLQVSYTGEVWLIQQAGLDKLAFEYSTNATSLTDGSWTAVTTLDFVPPGTVSGTGKKDGNAAANRAAVSATITGLSVPVDGVIWVRWNDTNISNPDNGLAIDDVQFGTPVDNPPTVATTPANGAANVAIAANIAVNFDEAVTLGASWYTLLCTSGSHSAVVSGGPVNYTLNPDSDFDYSESCTLSIDHTQVTDQDGTLDTMLADYVATFTTAAAPVDNPPTVQATTPANNASNVALAANIAITFDEAVTIDQATAAFTLTCGGNARTAVLSGSGASYTLNPDTDFTALEACDLVLFADHVSDQDGTIQQMVSNFLLHFTAGATSSDYYASVCSHTGNGPELKAALHELIKNHTAVSYAGAPPNALTVINLADEDPHDPTQSNILDVYKNHSCPKQLSGATCYNKEHTWPNSLGFNNLETVNSLPYPPFTDTHMLFASDVGYNSHRGNKPYGNCTSGCSVDATESYFGFGGLGDDNLYDSSVYQVWSHRKGDTARAVLYMDVRYKGGTNNYGQQEPNLQVTDNVSLIQTTNTVGANGYMGLKSALIAWSAQDPPDDYERLRNDAVFSFQQNRNPFIDHPEWVDCVFNNTNCPVPNCSDVIFKNGFE